MSRLKTYIFSVLLQRDSPQTMQQIIDAVPGWHFVSVYRAMDTLHKAGVVKRLSRGFKTLYELGDSFYPHHHHATCEQCGISIEIKDNNLEAYFKQIAQQVGVQPLRHTFEIVGVCKQCTLRHPC